MDTTTNVRQFTMADLKLMWCRLVSHYFEWLAGVPEVKQLNELDKVGRMSIGNFGLDASSYEAIVQSDLLDSGLEDLSVRHQRRIDIRMWSSVDS